MFRRHLRWSPPVFNLKHLDCIVEALATGILIGLGAYATGLASAIGG